MSEKQKAEAKIPSENRKKEEGKDEEKKEEKKEEKGEEKKEEKKDEKKDEKKEGFIPPELEGIASLYSTSESSFNN
jgi:hypothetical protein